MALAREGLELLRDAPARAVLACGGRRVYEFGSTDAAPRSGVPPRACVHGELA